MADKRGRETLLDGDCERELAALLACHDAPVIEPGDQAPDFSLPDQDGRAVKLSDHRGQNVVLYFYPKADTPGSKSNHCG